MAKQLLSYTDDKGNIYDSSYWRITELLVDTKSNFGRYTFSGYKDSAARLSNKGIIGRISFTITGDLFVKYYSEVISKQLNPAEVGYTICTLIQPDGTPISYDDDGNKIVNLFFDKSSLDV